MIQVSHKLRLTKQARYEPKRAGTETRRTTTALRPWEDWGEAAVGKKQ
jgi:hypothetical protein